MILETLFTRKPPVAHTKILGLIFSKGGVIVHREQAVTFK